MAGCPVVLDSPFAQAVLAFNPEYYWQCQDEDVPPYVLVDSGSEGLDLDQRAGTNGFRNPGPQVPGVPCDMAIGYAGVGSYYTDATFAYQLDDLTVLFWLYTGTLGLTQLFEVGVANNSNGFEIRHTGIGQIRLRFDGFINGSFSSVLANNAWYFVAVTRESGQWKIYLDGAVDNASAGTQTPSPLILPDRLQIGDIGGDLSKMAHVAYLFQPLSAGDIAALYATV